MPLLEPPLIDRRTEDHVAAQVEDLAFRYSGWQPGGMDTGNALVRIFARMAGQVIERINRLPERNFLAFLELIGTQPEPAQAARVPLTFQLAAGSPVDALVPAGTQVATEGDAEPVVFATERDLVVTRTQLAAAFVREPEADRYRDLTVQQPFSPFRGDQPIPHALYLSHPWLALPESKSLDVRITPGDTSLPWLATIAWERWDGTAWRSLPATVVLETTQPARWRVSFTGLPALAPSAVNGISAGWLRARLTQPLLRNTALPRIDRIELAVSIDRRATDARVPVDAGLVNQQPVDPSRDFFPFGERPRVGDAVYLASEQVFSRPGASVELNVGLTNVTNAQLVPPPALSTTVVLAWEMWDGSRWQLLGYSGPGATAGETSLNTANQFSDGTNAFLVEGVVRFTCPATLSPVEAGGQVRRWIRARIVRGGYGSEAQYQPVRDANGNQVYSNGVPLYQLVPASFRPPSIRSLRLGYLFNPSSALAERVVTGNDFVLTDAAAGTTFTPFVPVEDEQPALYLGFDRAFANRATSLYFGVARSFYDPDAAPREVTEEAAVVWEHWNGSGWHRLGTRDETRGFTRRGLVTFVGPPEARESIEFGRRAFWLRARWERGEYAVEPQIERILTNTTWAVHSEAGEAGNLPAGRLTQLRGTVPYVDAVAQLEPAEGGAAEESLDAVRVRGPKTLRHRDRAVAAADYEDLAFLASPEVARSQAIAARGAGDAGAVELIVVPSSSESRPVPSLELLDRVRSSVEARLPATVDLRVAGPDWLRVTVQAEIVPQKLEAATDVQADVLARLRIFLHPLTGGSDGQGWAFGRKPYRSDIYSLIESTPGVDHVRRLDVTETAEEGGARSGRFLVFSGDHQVLASSSLDGVFQ